MREWWDRAEEYIETLDQKYIFLIVITIIAFFSLGFWYFAFEPVKQELSNTQQAIDKTIQKIQKLSKSTIASKIQQTKREIAQINQEIERLKSQRYRLLLQLQKENYKLLNKRNFYQFLTKALDRSVKYNVTLDKLELIPLHKQFVGDLYIAQKMNIEGSGRFLDIVKWLRSMEDERLLLKVDRFHVELQDNSPIFSLSILFYGNSL